MAGEFVADPFVPQLYRVGRMHRELPDTVTLELMPEHGRRLSFEPGQFNMLYAFGVGEVAVSMSGSCENESTFTHTVRDVGAVSNALARLEPGAAVGVRGPFGTGWPVEAAEGGDLVVIAGGLGIAPLRPAIYHALHNRTRYGRVVILFGSRSPSGILYREEVESWSRKYDVEVALTVDHADVAWHGHVGVVPALIPGLDLDPARSIALVCGPEVMMRFSVTGLLQAGFPSERIYVSMERNMKCAIGLCGHCQFGPHFLCKDGAVLRYDKVAGIFTVLEV
ncbi:FAD/NAD(P)-binding protein [Consotaella aegiceratis]|uniref:FAD/NAD(P)-binding protein n=1 Tax=Consotaella aegiceratis TaxID=3097961 RepID=UPI002F3E624B